MMNTKANLAVLAGITCLLTTVAVAVNSEAPGLHTVQSKRLSVTLSDEGEITIGFGAQPALRTVHGLTVLGGCSVKAVSFSSLPEGGVKLTKTLFHEQNQHTLTLVERFRPSTTGIRWEIEIRDVGPAWSTPIQTRLEYPVTSATRFWTAWADPRHEIAGRMNREDMLSAGIVPAAKAGGDWADPLVPVPMGDAEFWYGAPPYRYDETGIPFCPNSQAGEQVFCIPLATVMECDSDIGLSLVLSPEDVLLDMSLTTTKEGSITFSRFSHRLGRGKPVHFAMDLIVHQADWRPALGWMVHRYSQFFDPPNPQADRIAGTGAYSTHWADFDAEKMKAMAFMVNWKASFDFPYMGMFLPPVETDDTPWQRYGGGTVTIGAMREYARRMREMGFHVLSYFNVTEFGANVVFPAPQAKPPSNADLWKDCNAFLYTKLADAMMLTPAGERPHKGFYGTTGPGQPYWTWGRAVVMDPGEPVYQAYLLNQARRHLEKLPEASGFCIDRMDWLRLYNHRRDDGVSWFGNQAVRSLNTSWRDLMSKLGPLVHGAGKVLYCNNHVKRVEQMRHIDGIFDEFTYSGLPLNTVSLLGVRKPVLGWTANQNQPSISYLLEVCRTSSTITACAEGSPRTVLWRYARCRFAMTNRIT